MAQYDLLLTQNVAPSGIEFSEKYVNLPKGSILTAVAGNTPTALPAGTDGYVLTADNAEPTGLKWQAAVAGHTQNTDTGTTSATFAIDSDGYNLPITAESASKLGIKVAGGATYADLQAKDATFNKVTVPTAPSAGTDLTNKTYVDGLLASLNGALVFKGNIKTTGGDITPTAFNALSTYSVGWQYRAAEAGTFRGTVCEIGDILTAIVARAGSGAVDADWTVSQTNLDGAVIGPASSTDNYIALFNGATGKLLKQSSGAVGTMAYETATNYVPKSLYDANSILYATTDNTPAALTVGASTIIGRKATGDISAMTGAEATALLSNVVAAGAAGLMTGADKTKLDGIAAGAQVNVATNLALGTVTATTQPITNSNGTGFILPVAVATTAAGLMSGADKAKLDGVATGANNYVHPTTAGNIHLPAAGASAQILQYSAAGTAKWISVSGDLTIADNGATTIGNGAVTLAKMANVGTGTVFYRKSASTGAPEVQTLSTLKTDLGTMPIEWVSVPTNMTSSGTAGQVARDTNFLYICTGTNVWKRTPIATNW